MPIPFRSDGESSNEDKEGTSYTSGGGALLDECSMVCGPTLNGSGCANQVNGQECSGSTSEHNSSGGGSTGMEPSRVEDIRPLLTQNGFKEKVAVRIANARRGTAGVDAAWKLWHDWCIANKVDRLTPSASDLCNWMAEMENNGYAIGTIRQYKSAICQTFELLFAIRLGDSLAVKKFVKSIAMEKPAKAKFSETFDIDLLTDWMEENVAKNSKLSEKDLRLKVILLLRIYSLKRNQDVVRITKDSLVLKGDQVLE